MHSMQPRYRTAPVAGGAARAAEAEAAAVEDAEDAGAKRGPANQIVLDLRPILRSPRIVRLRALLHAAERVVDGVHIDEAAGEAFPRLRGAGGRALAAQHPYDREPRAALWWVGEAQQLGWHFAGLVKATHR